MDREDVYISKVLLSAKCFYQQSASISKVFTQQKVSLRSN